MLRVGRGCRVSHAPQPSHVDPIHLKRPPSPAGLSPQVTVHIKGQTECYECTHRGSQQRSFPVCTLRNTPDKPIHCIVWAKEMLFGRLFGPPESVTGAQPQLLWLCRNALRTWAGTPEV